jgi:hypothetical protein
MAEDGDIYIESSGYFIGVNGSDTGDVTANTNVRPSASGDYDLGLSWALWDNIYAASGAISTSDATKKKNIEYGLSYMNNFFDDLKPATYQMINGTSGRTHVGFISQDVEQSLEKNNIASTDFAGFIKSPKHNEDGYDYALRYSEFIALNTWQIQQLKARVAELEAKLR